MDQEYKDLSFELELVYFQNMLRKIENLVILVKFYAEKNEVNKMNNEMVSFNEIIKKAKDSLKNMKIKFKDRKICEVVDNTRCGIFKKVFGKKD